MALTIKDLEQLVPTINSIAKVFYYNPSYSQLRKLYELEDYQQSIFYKLLYRDNYKRFDDQFKLKSFIYRVCKSVALQLATRKNTEDCVLDQPVGDGGVVMVDRFAAEQLEVDPDAKLTIDRIIISMPEDENKRVFIQSSTGAVPFSLENLFKVFISEKCSKNELHRMVINRSNMEPVTLPTYLKMWDKMISIINDELK